jgi:hypothetical protein
MQRRAFLSSSVLVPLAGCTGNSPVGGSTEDLLSDKLPSEGVYEFRKQVDYEVIQITADRLKIRDSVEYNNPEQATIKEWNPGEDKKIVVSTFSVENLSDEELDYPRWDEFVLVTPDEEIEPVLETPDGTSVEEFEEPFVSWPRSSGLRENYQRGWDAVYVAPEQKARNYAVKWTLPENPIYWRKK